MLKPRKILPPGLLNILRKSLIRYQDLHGFDYTVYELVNMYRQNVQSTVVMGQMLNDAIIENKTSDTLFILGSGPSINELDEGFFEHVSQHDSIGFNYWFLHPFVPRFYLYQPDRAGGPMTSMFYDRHPDYKHVPFILRGSGIAEGLLDLNSHELAPLKEMECYFLNEYPIHSKCSLDVLKLIEYVHLLGMMEHGKISKFVPKWRGSLGLLISFAYQMGYKTIVLCGVDMQDNSHFYDSDGYKAAQDKYKLPKSDIVAMTDRNHSANTVPDYIYALRDWMGQQAGVKIYLAHPQSVLHPELQLYEY